MILAFGAITGGITWASNKFDAASAPQGATRLSSCDREIHYCGRPVPRLGARSSDANLSVDPELVNIGRNVGGIIEDGQWCLTPKDDSCYTLPVRHKATVEDVRNARQALTKEGYPNHVVRLAKPDDPAPPGSLMYAVRVGQACVVGHTVDIPGVYPNYFHEVLGTFSNGSCINN